MSLNRISTCALFLFESTVNVASDNVDPASAAAYFVLPASVEILDEFLVGNLSLPDASKFLNSLLSLGKPKPTNPVSYTHLTLPTNREV